MRYFALLLVMIWLPASFAADVNGTKIKRLMMDRSYGERLFIQLENRQSTPIECHTNGSWEYALDTSDALGKQLYTALLSAYTSGRMLDLRGQKKCSLWSGIEDLDAAILR